MPRRKYVAKFTVTTVPLPPEMRLGWEMALLELWDIVDEYAARQEKKMLSTNFANGHELEEMERV